MSFFEGDRRVFEFGFLFKVNVVGAGFEAQFDSASGDFVEFGYEVFVGVAHEEAAVEGFG